MTMFGAKPGLNLKEVVVVDNARDDGAHVVGNLGIDRHNRVHVRVRLDARVERHARRVFKIVRRHEAEQPPAKLQRLLVILCDQVHHARAVHLRLRTAEFLGAHIFSGHLLDDLRAGDEHACLARLDHEVSQRRTVGCSAGTWAADDGDLRNGSRELHVAVEDAGITVEAVDALLHARAAGVVDEDERSAGLERHDHHFDDLAAMHLSRSAAEHREVLAGQVNETTVDRRCSCHDAIRGQIFAGHSEVGGAMHRKDSDLFKAGLVDQRGNAFACRQFAGCVLLFDPIPAAAKLQFGASSAQVGDPLLHGFGFYAFFQLGHSRSRSRVRVQTADAGRKCVHDAGREPAQRHSSVRNLRNSKRGTGTKM